MTLLSCLFSGRPLPSDTAALPCDNTRLLPHLSLPHFIFWLLSAWPPCCSSVLTRETGTAGTGTHTRAEVVWLPRGLAAWG